MHKRWNLFRAFSGPSVMFSSALVGLFNILRHLFYLMNDILIKQKNFAGTELEFISWIVEDVALMSQQYFVVTGLRFDHSYSPIVALSST